MSVTEISGRASMGAMKALDYAPGKPLAIALDMCAAWCQPDHIEDTFGRFE